MTTMTKRKENIMIIIGFIFFGILIMFSIIKG